MDLIKHLRIVITKYDENGYIVNPSEVFDFIINNIGLKYDFSELMILKDYFFDRVNKYNTYIYNKHKKAGIEIKEPKTFEANRVYANLRITEIPDDVYCYIDCCDGKESIHEKHKVWE